jgi:DNA-binding LytR/AlgR family response regulator
MYLVAVCDDEKKITEEVQRIITGWNPKIQVECFGSGEDLLAHYQPYHAIFMDIDMEGMNGIETGRKVRKLDKKTKIIYLTSYRDYVAGAFGVHAFQYLLKPVKGKEIAHVLEEVFQYLEKSKEQTILEFETVHGIVCLPADNIDYFEYENRRVRIVTEKESFYMKEKIGAVGERMKNFGFSMPHQSFVVNLLHVKNVRGNDIFMDNGQILPLAQKKQKSWKQELVAYLAGRLEGDA